MTPGAVRLRYRLTGGLTAAMRSRRCGRCDYCACRADLTAIAHRPHRPKNKADETISSQSMLPAWNFTAKTGRKIS